MPLTHTQIADIYDNQTLRKQIKGALILLSRTIANEPASTPNYVVRVANRAKVLTKLDEYSYQFVQHVINSAAVDQNTGQISDSEVSRVLNLLFDNYIP